MAMRAERLPLSGHLSVMPATGLSPADYGLRIQYMKFVPRRTIELPAMAGVAMNISSSLF
jgi:hypothetical protein